MRLTFIISIDPVKNLSLLGVLIHSLNVQTRRNFDVVFYNQTQLSEAEVFARLRVRPRFPYRWCSIDPGEFLGRYPLWDLYSLHRQLLEAGALGDYFMAMHMEEFFDSDYVEQVTEALEATRFDILLGNLCRTRVDEGDIRDIVDTADAREFAECLRACGLHRAVHWAFQRLPESPLGKLSVAKQNAAKWLDFGCRTQLAPSRSGFTVLGAHYEDLYFMHRDFALEHDWFLSGRRMYFEDIQLCDIPGVCELGRELANLTAFPRYFNRRRIYHLKHPKFYYQLEDEEFARRLLSLTTDEPLLRTLQEAVRMYRDGRMDLAGALAYTRRNEGGTGSQNLNHEYHMQALARRAACRTQDAG